MVPGKAVQFPDDHYIEQMLCAVLDHLLKLRAIVRLCGISAVNIMAKNRDIVLIGKSRALPDLTLDAFLSLIIRGIPGIDYSIHFSSPPSGSPLMLSASVSTRI